jgi:hypothetical protein
MTPLVRLVCPKCNERAGDLSRNGGQLELTMRGRSEPIVKAVADPRSRRPVPPRCRAVDELTWPCQGCRAQPTTLLGIEAGALADALDRAERKGNPARLVVRIALTPWR